MKALKTIISNPTNITYSGEDKDEKIIYIFRKSYIINFLWIFYTIILVALPMFLVSSIPAYYGADFIAAGTIFYYLMVFGYAFSQFSNWFFNVYIISNKKIIDVDLRGIGYKNISEAPIESIEDVTSTVRGFFGMTFNIGSVFVQTAGQSREFEFTQIDRPNVVRDLISDIASNKKRSHR